MLNYLNESYTYYYIKTFLIENGWHIIAGEPAGGSDDIPRVEIRDPNHKTKGSKGSYKIDLISIRGKVMLLTEVKVKYSESDIIKLTLLTSTKTSLLRNALLERLSIDTKDYRIVKSVALNDYKSIQIPKDFVCFCVLSEDNISIINRELLSEN